MYVIHGQGKFRCSCEYLRLWNFCLSKPVVLIQKLGGKKKDQNDENRSVFYILSRIDSAARLKYSMIHLCVAAHRLRNTSLNLCNIFDDPCFSDFAVSKILVNVN